MRTLSVSQAANLRHPAQPTSQSIKGARPVVQLGAALNPPVHCKLTSADAESDSLFFQIEVKSKKPQCNTVFHAWPSAETNLLCCFCGGLIAAIPVAPRPATRAFTSYVPSYLQTRQ